MSPSSDWEPPFHLSLITGTFLEALNSDHHHPPLNPASLTFT